MQFLVIMDVNCRPSCGAFILSMGVTHAKMMIRSIFQPQKNLSGSNLRTNASLRFGMKKRAFRLGIWYKIHWTNLSLKSFSPTINAFLPTAVTYNGSLSLSLSLSPLRGNGNRPGTLLGGEDLLYSVHRPMEKMKSNNAETMTTQQY